MCLGTGANRDYLVVGSDSGKISVLEFDQSLNDWKVVHCEIFGKTGCRRIVPGQYLAAGRHCLSLSTPSLLDRITVSVVDPKGRALLIAAVEKQKFVYVMNRDSMNRLTISSPLGKWSLHNLLVVFAQA
jgi:splicing factor 3B subunit 3